MVREVLVIQLLLQDLGLQKVREVRGFPGGGGGGGGGGGRGGKRERKRERERERLK